MVVLLGGRDVVGRTVGDSVEVPLVGRAVVGASVGASVEVPLVGRAVVGASVGASVEVPLVGIAVVGASVGASVGAAVLVPLSDSGASEDVMVTEPEDVEEVTSVEEAEVLLENWAKVVEAKPADNRTVENFILIERTYFFVCLCNYNYVYW